MSCLLFANVRYILACSLTVGGRHIAALNADVVRSMYRVSVGDIRICCRRVMQPVHCHSSFPPITHNPVLCVIG